MNETLVGFTLLESRCYRSIAFESPVIIYACIRILWLAREGGGNIYIYLQKAQTEMREGEKQEVVELQRP